MLRPIYDGILVLPRQSRVSANLNLQPRPHYSRPPLKSMMHVGRGREHPLHIEYVHIGACLSFIQDTLTEALLSHPRLRLEKKVALVKALGKVIWIQNDLFAKWWYVSTPQDDMSCSS